MKTSTYAPFAKPLYVMVKPVGAVCNLACDYCYYLEKANLYKDNPKHVMSDELLEKFIDEYINSQTMPQVLFTWHGGETLMRPLSFYKKAMELQKKYVRGRTIDNCIQTNGTMLTDEWCEFFRENNWLVGVSIDGPQEFHDEYRKNKMGKPSFVKVMQGINLLKKHGVEWNAMAVINDFNADYPLDFYHFFKEIDCKYIQFAPIVERILEHQDGRHLASLAENQKGELADFSITPEQWGKFLCTLFDEWVKEDVGKYYIQIFDSTLANWVGEQPGICTEAPYTATFGITKAGTYSLTVVFNRQKYDGSKWENTGEQDTKQVSFSISQAQTVTATPTPQPNGANQKNAVRTGDTTNIAPFVIILVIATVCIVGVVVYKKKKK